MAQNQFERQLVAGVRAARQGNKQRARELLEGVLKRDRENEQAWIWMASIVSSTRERRICLERVLKINPNNRPARAAINSMVGVIGGESASIDFEAMSRAAKTALPSGGAGGQSRGPSTGASPAVGGGGRNNLMPLLIIAAVALGLIFVASLVVPRFFAQPTPVPTVVAAVEETAEVTEEDDGSTKAPTATSTAASIATIAPRDDLPTEMIILTDTPTPSETPTLEPTISALSNYNFVFLAVEGNFAPILYQVSGDGNNLQPMASNFYDMDVHPSGVVAYTQEEQIVLPSPTPSSTPTPLPQTTPEPFVESTPRPRTRIISKLFLTNLSNPLDSIEISNDTHTNAFSPSISPDGEQIAFASDADGDNDIYIYDIPSRSIFRVTNSTSNDIDPDWSPDGTQLVFASDRESPGRYDIFTLTLGNDVESSVTRVTKTRRGDNLQPQWSPIGDKVAFLNRDDSNGGISTVTLATGGVRQLTNQSSQSYSAPSWSSDGIYVIFTSDKARINGLRQIFMVNPDTLFEQILRLDGIDAKLAMER